MVHGDREVRQVGLAFEHGDQLDEVRSHVVDRRHLCCNSLAPLGAVLNGLVDCRVLEVGGEAQDADDLGEQDAGARLWEAVLPVLYFVALAVAESLLLGVSYDVFIELGIGINELTVYVDMTQSS